MNSIRRAKSGPAELLSASTAFLSPSVIIAGPGILQSLTFPCLPLTEEQPSSKAWETALALAFDFAESGVFPTASSQHLSLRCLVFSLTHLRPLSLVPERQDSLVLLIGHLLTSGCGRRQMRNRKEIFRISMEVADCPHLLFGGLQCSVKRPGCCHSSLSGSDL